MDDAPLVPLVFANRVIRQFADHLLGGVTIKPKDYAVMRLVFRKMGGNWEALVHGDVNQLTLLEKVVTRWKEFKTPEIPDVEQVTV